MDIKLSPKPWYIKYRYRLLFTAAVAILLVYVSLLALKPRQLRIAADSVQIAEVQDDKFLEYLDAEAVVQPILTIKINARGSGTVVSVISEEGSLLHRGDTILLLENPDLLSTIEDHRDEWEKQLMQYREKEIKMEQQRLQLQKQTLGTSYELVRLRQNYELEKEEFNMGIKSAAQLRLAEEEYNFKVKSAKLQQESLRHDSIAGLVRKEMLRAEREREQKKYRRALQQLETLCITAPIAGQLSYLNATHGQLVSPGESIAEIKVLDNFKLHTALSEYYISRITTGLPATIMHEGKKYPLKVAKVVPEVKERTFDVELHFTDSIPRDICIGKNFRIQIELEKAEQALVMPSGNFYQATGGQWIFKLSPDRTSATRVPLTLGSQNPRQYEITSGLQPGDLVIITGYDNFGNAEKLILK
ncbi:MAG: efflux RND transporter periplasmic adaptor subunit [Bacteroides sp.]|nr:efflux RND transporter periplasmic adaptor subunit [Bacteroides sp.]